MFTPTESCCQREPSLKSVTPSLPCTSLSLSLSGTFCAPSDLYNMCWLSVPTQWKRLPLAERRCYKEPARQSTRKTVRKLQHIPVRSHTHAHKTHTHVCAYKVRQNFLWCLTYSGILVIAMMRVFAFVAKWPWGHINTSKASGDVRWFSLCFPLF